MVLVLTLFSCTEDPIVEDSPRDSGGLAVCEEPVEPACVDAMILDLALHDDKVSDGAVTNTADGDAWYTSVDATAGGYGNSSDNPWVYLRFTDAGAERVDIDDETALESMDWDLAARRFILRLNGGDSGPSCVGAATLMEQGWDDVAEAPEGISYAVDDYYTDDCTMVNDSSGLPGSPQVVLGPWWSYSACIATTGYVQLIQLADGRVVKFVVDRYYEEAAHQDTCNETGEAPQAATSAIYTFHWQLLP